MNFVKKRLLVVELKRPSSEVEEEASGDGVTMASDHNKKKQQCYQYGKY